MKLFKKLFKIAAICLGVLIALIIVIAVVSSKDDEVKTTSNDSPKVSTNSKQSTEQPAANEKKFDAAYTHTFGGLKINVAEVKITENKIVVGMNFENTTQQKLTFYPDQGNAIVGTMQLAANMFMGSGEVSGDINAGVKMDGTIEFLAPEGKSIDVKNVKQIKLALGDIFNDSTYNTADATIIIPVK